MYNNIKYLKNNRCGKFQSLTDIDKGSSVLKDEVCTASGAVLFFCGTHLFAKHKMFSENVFRLFFKEKIREVVVDIVRHLFSRRRTIAYQLFAKKSFGE